jgi:hypothetical protein
VDDAVSDLHDCPADGCPKRLPFEMMACRKHWFVLPPALRRDINRAWRTGDVVETIRLRREVGLILNGKPVE